MHTVELTCNIAIYYLSENSRGGVHLRKLFKVHMGALINVIFHNQHIYSLSNGLLGFSFF